MIFDVEKRKKEITHEKIIEKNDAIESEIEQDISFDQREEESQKEDTNIYIFILMIFKFEIING